MNIDIHDTLSKNALTFRGGKRYEDEYGGYLNIFGDLVAAVNAGGCCCENVPPSWVALIRYIGATVADTLAYFDEDTNVQVPLSAPLTRHYVSAMCCHRPETVDFLWKLDYRGFVSPTVPNLKEPFPVTCNGSFYRKEVSEYLADISRDIVNGEFKDYKNVILVPCAADKPYPSPMHNAVMDIAAKVQESTGIEWKLVTVTGVLGVVPDCLWSTMPNYDSGIPNEWRCMRLVRAFLRYVNPNRVVSYSDYYNEAISEACNVLNTKVDYVNDVTFYADYLDLLDVVRLKALEVQLMETSKRSVK